MGADAGVGAGAGVGIFSSLGCGDTLVDVAGFSPSACMPVKTPLIRDITSSKAEIGASLKPGRECALSMLGLAANGLADDEAGGRVRSSKASLNGFSVLEIYQ